MTLAHAWIVLVTKETVANGLFISPKTLMDLNINQATDF